MTVDELPILGLPVLEAGYSATGQYDTSGTSNRGGNRIRRDFIGSTRFINISWSLDSAQHKYIELFYKNTLKGGALKFKIKIPIDEMECREYVAHFAPDTFKFSSRKGSRDIYSATIEVYPLNSISQSDDNAYVVLMGAFGGDVEQIYKAYDYSNCVNDCYITHANRTTVH